MQGPSCTGAAYTGLLILVVAARAAAVASITLTPCGATGSSGPTQSSCSAYYSSVGVSGISISGGVQSWFVPTTGLYNITAGGASGYGGLLTDRCRGAVVSEIVTLGAGTQLLFLVGQVGTVCSQNNPSHYGGSCGNNGPWYSNGSIISASGGGGGTFVTYSNNSPVVVAGGGGGIQGCDPTISTTSCATATGDLCATACTTNPLPFNTVPAAMHL